MNYLIFNKIDSGKKNESGPEDTGGTDTKKKEAPRARGRARCRWDLLIKDGGGLLTSSTRTPKFISKQWSDTLMPFHKHSPIDSLLALRQCHLYCHDGPGKSEHLVHTHIYVG